MGKKTKYYLKCLSCYIAICLSLALLSPVISSAQVIETENTIPQEYRIPFETMKFKYADSGNWFKGRIQKLEVEVTPEINNDEIVWFSADDSVATVDQNGNVHATGFGKTTILARSRYGPAQAIYFLTVYTTTPIGAISFTRPDYEVLLGKTREFKVNIAPENAEDLVDWYSSDDNIVSVERTGDFTSKITAHNQGTVTLTAVARSNNKIKTICSIKVVEDETIKETVEFDKLPKSLYKNGSYTVKLHDKITKLDPVQINYEANSKNIIVTPSAINGLTGFQLTVNDVTSGKNKGEKLDLKATVKYLDKKGNEKTKIFKAKTILVNPVKSIAIDSNDIVICSKNIKHMLTAEFNYGDSEDLPTNQKLKWLITDETGKANTEMAKKGKKVISLNAKGQITPKAPGVAYVTLAAVDSYDKETKSYKLFDTIKVTCPQVEKLTFKNDVQLSIAPNKTLDLKSALIINPLGTFNSEKMKIKWSTNNRKVASVSSKGIVKAGKFLGTTVIKVEAVGGVPKGEAIPTAEIFITVEEQPAT